MEEKIRNQNGKVRFLLKLSFCFALLLVAILLPNVCYGTTESGYKYLSDEDINPISTRVGWDSFRKNQINDGSLISVKVEGTYYTFEKGLWAHAASTLVYDLNEYDYDYFTAYVGLNQTAGGQSNGVVYKIYTSTNGTDWHIQYNEEGKVSKRGDDADFVKIDIRNEKFLKLEIGSNGGNGGDHSVFADAKLIKEGYKEPGEELVPSITELDTKIKEFVASNADLSKNKEYELTLLKRELISRMGDYALRKFLGESEANRALYRWLTGDVDILRLYVMGGKPDGGNYYTSLSILTRLYEEYSSDFENGDFIERPESYSKMTYGELYKKMAMSVALTHTQRVGLWMNSSTVENQSEPLRRYAIFKYLHKNGGMRMAATMDMTHQFEDLHVSEMRLVLYNNIDDEEILWLNRYTQDNIDANPNNVWRYQTPHPYIAYVWPNYGNPVYFENEEYFNELFAVNKTDNNKGKEIVNEEGEKTGKIGLFDSEFVIPGGKNVKEYRIKVTKPKVIENTAEGTIEKKTYKVWMNFRNKFGTGCVCGGISKSGANIRGTHGIPAMVIGQPGHAALLFYSKDAQGRGFWRIDNDVSGWTASGGGGRLLGWGSGSYAYGFSNGVYVELEQAAINDYQNLIKAEEQVMLAKVYTSDLEDETKKQEALKKQEEIYRNVVGTKSTNNEDAKKGIQSINFDAWLGLIDVYNASTNKTENDYYELAEEIAEALKYFPLPMYNATNLIKPKITSVENVYRFTLLQTRTIKAASTLPNNTADSFTVMQPGVARVEANFLLGKMDAAVANFSFDGVDAGKIVLASRFSGNGVRWDYSLDGKETWKEVSFTGEEENKLQLKPEELASITAENDIYVHIVGVDYSENNLYKIDILEAPSLPATLYANDLENRVIGVDLAYEWRNSENDSWTSYQTASPDNTGDKTLQVRIAATGTRLASEIGTFTFTTDNQTDKRQYVSISHLTLHAFSEENTKYKGQAVNAIDGNFNTFWYNNVSNRDLKPSITIKLDKPRYVSAVEVVPHILNNYGRLKAGVLMGSEDGENWIELKRFEDLPTDYDVLKLEIDEPKEVSYLKIDADTTNFNNYFFVKMINVFQDLTINPHPTAGIAYSTTEPTNEPVIARLVNPSTEITITNNEGNDSIVFTKNGEFTFEFVDKKGKTGSATAKVDWIDTDKPSADVNYDLDDDRKLLVLLDNISEDVYMLDQDNRKINYIEVDANKKVTNITYLDNEGNAYKVLDKDASGDTTKITYKNTVKDTMENPTEKMREVETYITIFEKREDEIVTIEKYLDNVGNEVTDLTDADKEALRKLQETARSNPLEYALETSGEYEFKLVDKSGNLLYKNIKVDYIENSNIIIASDISYSTTTLTNQDVVATINPYIIDTTGKEASVEMVNNDKNKTYTFTESGEFTFKYKDASDTDGDDIKQHTATVDWIDKVNPTAEVQYSITEGVVTATLVNESEDITIINNGGKREYTFTESEEFTFEFQDKAGNRGTVTATRDDAQIKGDIDGDGSLTINDMALLKLHLISIKEIEENALIKADIDGDNEITIGDLARMKLILLGL